ncbi:MAG TPA: TatD family hydrolase [candidate division Zixibacteria bacterium]|jgi:TatD DNase family protein
MIDSHAHLNFDAFDSDRDAVVERAHQAGVHTIINIATDFESCERVLELAERYERTYATVGIHPHDAGIWEGSASTKRLMELAQHPKVVAIGEIGLDYYRNLSPPDQQRRAFIEQMAVARDCQLPIVIHNRDAFDDIFALVLKSGTPSLGGVFHCFSESPQTARQVIDLGFHVSVNGIVTFKNATMSEVARTVRLDRMLLETDCPFLAPHPHRARRNEPSYIPLVAAHIATLRGIDVTDVEAQTDANVRRLFRLGD